MFVPIVIIVLVRSGGTAALEDLRQLDA
ncbi:MAG: hypothetical protein QOD73_2510, partial [Solirubrobacteraceae bacterium]|nr:hypothetical protein [Solirubrobacteraceae bacterium]